MAEKTLAYGVEVSNRRYRLRMARYPHFCRLLRDLADGRGPLDVLDVGTGNGRTARFVGALLPDLAIRLSGIELSRERLQASAGLGYRSLVRGNALLMPFRAESFDVVVAMHVLEHVRTPEKMLAEFHRVLRPQGSLILGVPILPPEILSLQRFFQPLIDWTDDLRGIRRDHELLLSRQSLEVLLRRSGFRVLSVRGFRLFSLPANWLEDYRWWHSFQGRLGRAVPSLACEVNVLARKRARAGTLT